MTWLCVAIGPTSPNDNAELEALPLLMVKRDAELLEKNQDAAAQVGGDVARLQALAVELDAMSRDQFHHKSARYSIALSRVLLRSSGWSSVLDSTILKFWAPKNLAAATSSVNSRLITMVAKP